MLDKKKQKTKWGVIATLREEKEGSRQCLICNRLQNGPILWKICLGLKQGSLLVVSPLEISQAVYEGRQQQDIHFLHTKTDEEEGCVDVTQCICFK